MSYPKVYEHLERSIDSCNDNGWASRNDVSCGLRFEEHPLSNPEDGYYLCVVCHYCGIEASVQDEVDEPDAAAPTPDAGPERSEGKD